jgi:hypothetical protein
MRGIRDLNLLYVSYNESATAFSLTCVPSMDAPFRKRLTALTGTGPFPSSLVPFETERWSLLILERLFGV